jgi:hypothetical protein
VKSISAAIVLLAAAICYASGALSRDPEYSQAASWAGIIVGAIGLLGWLAALGEPRRDKSRDD